MSTCPLFVELCAGTAALSLRLHGGRHARPPVSRMGAKTGYATAILRVLGLRPGQGMVDGTRYLWCEPDAGVRLLLEAYRDRELAQAAAEIIRSWKDEEPRALWERLRAEGPARHVCEAREVARWLYVHARAHGMGRGSTFAPEHNGRAAGGQDGNGPPRPVLASRVAGIGCTPATIAPDACEVDPREVARWVLLPAWSYRQGDVTSGPATPDTCHHTSADGVAARLGSVAAVPATIAPGAREVDPPVPLPPGTVAYMDPPYLNTTGYTHDLGRDEVVGLARRWADAGALVCISEAEPIPDLVADGWHTVEITRERRGQRRTFSKQQREWLTLNQRPAWRPSVQRGLFDA